MTDPKTCLQCPVLANCCCDHLLTNVSDGEYGDNNGWGASFVAIVVMMVMVVMTMMVMVVVMLGNINHHQNEHQSIFSSSSPILNWLRPGLGCFFASNDDDQDRHPGGNSHDIAL